MKCKYTKIFNKSENVRRAKHFWNFRVRIATKRTLVNFVTKLITVKVKHSHYRPWRGPEGSRRLRLTDFKTFSTE